MEIKINKEIRDYQESIIMGLSARQFLFSAAAVVAAVGVYFTPKKPLGNETVSWVSVLAAFPFAALGFVKYHGMTAEQFIAAYVKQQMMPKELPSMPDTGYHSLIGQEPTLVYDDDTNDLLSSTDPLGNETKYTYDNHHNMLTVTSEEKVITTYTYDTNGNVLTTKVWNADVSDHIDSSTAYDSASALATAVTDARGNSVTYDYDSTTRQQATITDPKGYESTYTYGDAASMLRLASLTSDGTGTVGYTYDAYGKLTRIARGGTYYNFTYDAWGRIVDTKVGNLVLSTNHYDAFGRLDYVLYGNDYKTEYEYDSLDRVYQINQGLAHPLSLDDDVKLVYEFIYNGEGDLYELRNYKTYRATFFEYDHAGRCMASTEKTFTGGNNSAISYTGVVSGYKYEYDLNNNLTKLTCSLDNTTWAAEYSFDGDNRPTATTLHNGRSFVNTYDGIGRITSIALKNGNSVIHNTAITYVPGANGSQTALVSTYTNGNDDAYSYSYDANGNITSITKGSQSFTYEYDAANQLVRENLYYGSGNSNNATYTYTYDSWGNILKKRSYAYTVNDLPATAQSEISYGYDSRGWCDLLTSYNGQTITYDAMGNPTSYLGKTLVWDGKQLRSISRSYNGNQLFEYSFSYNEDGLRTEKHVSAYGISGDTTNYYYNGSVLIGMSNPDAVQRFSYDASGKVVSVDFSTDDGSTYTTYYYLRNAQGDIVKLIDGNGTTVVEYTYDSWGKVLSTDGTLKYTLGLDQPFRYRGYVYDRETQWYYLQSRYYDPAVRRFISADVYLSTGQGVIGHNSFAYCLNMPTNGQDSNGHVFRPYSVMMTDGGGGSPHPVVILGSNSNNGRFDVGSDYVYNYLVDTGYFDNEDWGDIASITIHQLDDTIVENNDLAAIIFGAAGVGACFIPGVGSTIAGCVLAIGSTTFALANAPDGVYNTFAITITGTTTIESCAVKTNVQYKYYAKFMYIPNGNNARPYLYVLSESFILL